MCQSESSQEKRNHNCFNKDNFMWGVGQMGNGRDTDKTDTKFQEVPSFLVLGKQREEISVLKKPRHLEQVSSELLAWWLPL